MLPLPLGRDCSAMLLCLGSRNRRPPEVAGPWICSVQSLGFRSGLRSYRLFVFALRKINSSFILFVFFKYRWIWWMDAALIYGLILFTVSVGLCSRCAFSPGSNITCNMILALVSLALARRKQGDERQLLRWLGSTCTSGFGRDSLCAKKKWNGSDRPHLESNGKT